MLAVLSTSCFAGLAIAQESSPFSPFHEVHYPLTPPMAWQRHASTAYQGARYGDAAWVTSLGYYELMSAQAAILRQVEYNLAMQNKVNKTTYYIQRKQLLTNFWELERLRKVVRRREAQELMPVRERQRAEEYQLSDYEFDQETGMIYWPALLASPRYAHYRHSIEEQLAQLFRYGSFISKKDCENIARSCDKFGFQVWEDLIKREGLDYESASQEYSSSKRLLKGLRYAPVLMADSDHVDIPLEVLSMN
jgi:hypothetical protein